jgi:hypothetical protein
MYATPVFSIETASTCLPCEAIQHAATLAEIEKYLEQSNPLTVAQLDKEAQKWFSTFQEGGMLFDGWKDISDKVINKVPEKAKVQTKLQMLALGVRMGCEWSKENDIRKISTKMLKNWGKEIRKVVDKSPHDIPVVIKRIECEVDALLFPEQ